MLQHSTMLELGTQLIDFRLPDPATGSSVGPGDCADCQALLIVFVCNHCPYVVHIADGLAQLAEEFRPRGLGVIAISSNEINQHPADSPDNMVTQAKAWGWRFPYLYDASQEVAKAYRAACTPDIYLFDAKRKLAYRGQFDDSRPGNGQPVTGADLRCAVDCVLQGLAVQEPQIPSAGCNIKWRSGNEPDYFG